MDAEKILDKIISLQAWAEGVNKIATELRKELEDVYSPAPRKGRKNVLSPETRARILARRRKTILKNQP